MTAAVFCFPECEPQARKFAAELALPLHPVALHRFPDAESLVTVAASPATAILYRTLNQPNGKLVELLFAASALRDTGAQRVMLVAPYLAYMRQDTAFAPGQAVSQRVVGMLIARHFDGLLTVDPHLHRVHLLSEVVPGIDAVSISAGPALSAILRDEAGEPVLVGPDGESRQWVEAIAGPLGAEVLIGSKTRAGDREVEIDFQGIEVVDGRTVVLVDDLISSGRTLATAARALKRAGARRIEVLATHCVAQDGVLEQLHAAGIARVRATDTVTGPVCVLPVGHLLADAVRSRAWLER